MVPIPTYESLRLPVEDAFRRFLQIWLVVMAECSAAARFYRLGKARRWWFPLFFSVVLCVYIHSIRSAMCQTKTPCGLMRSASSCHQKNHEPSMNFPAHHKLQLHQHYSRKQRRNQSSEIHQHGITDSQHYDRIMEIQDMGPFFMCFFDQGSGRPTLYSHRRGGSDGDWGMDGLGTTEVYKVYMMRSGHHWKKNIKNEKKHEENLDKPWRCVFSRKLFQWWGVRKCANGFVLPHGWNRLSCSLWVLLSCQNV